jgi:hypothetical protein
MTSFDFIKRLQMVVYQSAIDGTLSLLEKPPGRRPSPNLVVISQWYNQLPVREKENICATIQLAVRASVFGMLTVLDGVTSIREPGEERGFLELRYKTGAESVLLNNPGGELLHDLFAGEIPPA